MRLSTAWYAASMFCLFVSLVWSPAWVLGAALCLWRSDHCETQEHLKEIKERLDK